MAFQGLSKRSPLPSVTVLAPREGRLSGRGVMEGGALGLGSEDPSLQITAWSLILGLRSPHIRVFAL